MDLSLFFLVFMVSQSFLHFSWGGGHAERSGSVCLHTHFSDLQNTAVD